MTLRSAFLRTCPFFAPRCSLLISYQLVVMLSATWLALWLVPRLGPAGATSPPRSVDGSCILVFSATSAQSCSGPGGRSSRSPPSFLKCWECGISMRSTEEHEGSLPNAIPPDGCDLSQEQCPECRTRFIMPAKEMATSAMHSRDPGEAWLQSETPSTLRDLIMS